MAATPTVLKNGRLRGCPRRGPKLMRRGGFGAIPIHGDRCTYGTRSVMSRGGSRCPEEPLMDRRCYERPECSSRVMTIGTQRTSTIGEEWMIMCHESYHGRTPQFGYHLTHGRESGTRMWASIITVTPGRDAGCGLSRRRRRKTRMSRTRQRGWEKGSDEVLPRLQPTHGSPTRESLSGIRPRATRLD